MIWKFSDTNLGIKKNNLIKTAATIQIKGKATSYYNFLKKVKILDKHVEVK